MTAIEKIRAAVEAEKRGSGAQQIGLVVLELAKSCPRAAELIAQDLDQKEMSLEKCFAALKAYAKAHQQGGFWGCMCNTIEADNPVVQVICEFYKIPAEWLGDPAPAEPEKPKRLGSAPVDLFDLL